MLFLIFSLYQPGYASTWRAYIDADGVNIISEDEDDDSVHISDTESIFIDDLDERRLFGYDEVINID